MGGGLVLSGIGSDVSGGLGDLFTAAAAATTRPRSVAEADRGRGEDAQPDPDNRAALAQIARGHYQLATADADPNTSEFATKARPELRATAEAWQRYDQAVAKPDPRSHARPSRPTTASPRLEKEAAGRKKYARARRRGGVGSRRRSQGAELHPARAVRHLAGQKRKAELAGKKAIELAPKDQKKQAKQPVEQAKAQPPPQQAQAAQGGQAPAPVP